MRKVVSGILFVVLVSGCTMPGDFLGGFNIGGDVNKTEQSPDLIVIQNIDVIPSPPINAGDSFTVAFTVFNQDDINDVNISYSLYDIGLCRKTSQELLEGTVDMAPLQTEFKEWTFTSPSTSEIGGLSTSCPMKFLVSYSFDSKSQIDVDVISSERLYEMQRAGQTVSYTPSLSVGIGPVKVYFSFGTSLPVRNSSILPMFIDIEDKGDGILRKIDANSLVLTIPQEFAANCNGFSCSSGVCKNQQEIPMIKKNAPQIRCELTAPNAQAINNLEKTFYISGTLNYDYEITGETSVGIKPVLT